MSTPCQADPDLWWSDHPGEVRAAIAGCAWCPEQADCLAGALERGERYGVWGGVDLSGRVGRGNNPNSHRRRSAA